MPHFVRRPPAIAEIVSTFVYSGYAPFAPGTAGSLAALVPPGLLIFVDPRGFQSTFSSLVFIPLFSILGIFSFLAVRAYVSCMPSESQDPGCIVIDEVLGIWLSLFVTLTALSLLQPMDDSYGFIVLLFLITFVTFRFFDIVKPWPISWCDRKIKGAFGVILDDLVAGIFSGLLTAVILVALQHV